MNTADPTVTARLRDKARRARRNLREEVRRTASVRIGRRFLHSREFLACTTLACYLPAWDEVDTRSIIERAWRAKKRIFAPVTDTHGGMRFHEIRRDTPLVRNAFGLWEPTSRRTIDPHRLDVVVTPLVAFDENLHRIGMGGGYFDRCFSFLRNRKVWLRPKLVGLAFDCQKVEKFTPNPWDIRLYRIFTERVQG